MNRTIILYKRRFISKMDNDQNKNNNSNSNLNYEGAFAQYQANSDTNPSQHELQNVPTNEVEYAAGRPEPAQFALTVGRVEDKATTGNNGPTVCLTDYSAATDFDYTEGSAAFMDQITPASRDSSDVASGVVGLSYNESAFISKREIPFALYRGTNIMVPFGAAHLLASITSEVTDFGQLQTLETNYSRASGTLGSGYTLREVNNFKSFTEMKDAIISYKSRTIAYTNLDVIDMFALEYSREANFAICALPLYAGKIAREFAAYLSSIGVKFNSKMTGNLTDPGIAQQELLLYQALAPQKTFDDTLWMRLNQLCKLYSSSERTGFTPQFILQDVNVAGLQAYRPSVKQNQYNVRTPKALGELWNKGTSGGSLWNQTNKRSLLSWISLYLGGERTKDILTENLLQATNLCNDTITGMKIVTGAIDTIEGNRGAAFHKIGEFLPIKGTHEVGGNVFLDFILTKPVFSYYYKERVEHAPSMTMGKNLAGTISNNRWVTSLCRGLGGAFEEMSPSKRLSATFRRPVGLYKGEEAWKVDEIISVGLMRPVLADYNTAAFLYNTLSDVAISENANCNFTAWMGPNMTTTLNFTVNGTSGAIAFGTGTTADSFYGLFVDEVFGDVFMDSLVAPAVGMSEDEPVGDTRLAHTDVIQYCGTSQQQDRTNFESWTPILGDYTPSASFSQVWNGSVPTFNAVYTQGVNYYSSTSRNVLTACALINYAYSYLDISQGPQIPAGTTTSTDNPGIPYQWYTPYRGAQWYTITLNTVASVIIAMSHAFSLTYKNNAQVRASRVGQSSSTTETVPSK